MEDSEKKPEPDHKTEVQAAELKTTELKPTKIGIEGATTNTDSFERQRSAIRAQLNADKLAIEAKIKELELKSPR